MNIERFEDGFTVFFEGDEVYFDSYEEAEAFVEEHEDKGMADLERAVGREFWTRLEEMVEDIEELGYTVDEANDEYMAVTDSDDREYTLYLGHANTTIWVERIR